MQLNESGVTSYQSLAKAMGISVTSLQAKMQKGQISAADAITGIMRDWDTRFRGAAAAQSKTFNGMVSNLKDAFGQMLGEAMMPLFKMLETQLLPALVSATPAIKAIAIVIGATLVTTLTSLAYVLGFVSKNWDYIAVVLGVVTVAVLTYNAAAIVSKTVTLATTAATKAWAAAQWLLNAALDANPIGLVVIALAAIVGAFILAYRHSSQFRSIVQSTWTWIRDHWQLLVGIMAGPLGMAAVLIISHFNEIKTVVIPIVRWLIQAFKDLTHWVSTAADAVGKVSGKVPWSTLAKMASPGAFVGQKVLGAFATGGTAQHTGPYVVGERGPEIVTLGRGASVFPTPAVAPVGPSLEPRAGQTIVTKVYLDKRQVAEAVGSYVSDQRARR
jgi:hypothetical protein